MITFYQQKTVHVIINYKIVYLINIFIFYFSPNNQKEERRINYFVSTIFWNEGNQWSNNQRLGLAHRSFVIFLQYF